MYLPDAFKNTEPEAVWSLLQRYPFGMLITTEGNIPQVSHLPFLVRRPKGSNGMLLGHMARANPQSRQLAGADLLAVFQGPHAYVSPSLYSSPGVPTWNYAVVHVHGTARMMEDEGDLQLMLDELTDNFESRRAGPWQPAFSKERRSRLFEQIVGFEIEISDVTAKFKLSQNRPLDDRHRIADALSQSESAAERALGDLMIHSLPTALGAGS